ncbi:MAG: ABC transporter ATP-binding protein [Aquificae bacterium]|nr:ABC transporter ATP-binding protein [Aquificota bacterium]
MSLLKVESLTVRYGSVEAVRGVSFEVGKGEVVCLVGESGSGKSTVLRAIGGLLPPEASADGSVLFLGKNLLKLPKKELDALRGNQIGFVFQEPSLYLDPLFKVGDQVAETCFIHHPDRDCRRQALLSLEKVGVEDPVRVYNSYPHQLSGGLKQRVNVADATVNGPLLLLADEPTTALDVSTQKVVLALFRRLKEEGSSILFVTHDFGVVWEIADRVVVLKDGRVVEEGSVFDLYREPKHPYTRKLVSIFKELAEF